MATMMKNTPIGAIIALIWTLSSRPITAPIPVKDPTETAIGGRAGSPSHVGTVHSDIMASAMPERTSAALGVRPGTPSLTVVRRYLDRERRLFMVSVSEHPGDRVTYSMGLERGWQSGGGAVWSGA